MGSSQRDQPLTRLKTEGTAVSEHPETVDPNEGDDLSVERALRVGLNEFELDDEDVSLLEREE